MNEKNKKLSRKDLLIIIASLILLAVLILVIFLARKSANQKAEALYNASTSKTTSGNGVSVETNSLCLNEANEAGWIEYYNSGSKAADISGYVLYLNGTAIKTYEDGTSVKPKDHFVTEIGQNPGARNENIIALYDKDGKEKLTLTVPSLSNGNSYGRTKDAGYEQSYMSATKGEDNSKAEVVASNDLEFSVPGGFYDTAFNLSINVPKGCTVYYTTDGKAPTEKSQKYEDKIEIKNRSGSDYKYVLDSFEYPISSNGYLPKSVDMGTVVRAIAVDSAGKIVAEKSESYFIGLGNNSGYQDLPVINIVTDGDGLFDYFKGMYVAGRSSEDNVASGGDGTTAANYYNKWNRSAEIEFYEPEKGRTYKGTANLSMIVDNTITLRQKSLMGVLSSEVNDGSALKKFVNQKNNSVAIEAYGSDNTYKIRELAFNKLIANESVGSVDMMPCVLFINGEYWGGYVLKTTEDENYISKHYGINGQHVLFSNANKRAVDYMDLVKFVETNDMKNEENYAKVEERMDVDNFIDFLCINLYLSHGSFNRELGTAWRTEDASGSGYADGKWRWIINDLSNTTLNDAQGNLTTYSIDTYLTPGFANDRFIQSLFMNEKFRDRLQARMTHFATDVFLPEKVEKQLNATADLMEKLTVKTENRFYGNMQEKDYENMIDNIVYFFEKRGRFILGYTSEIVANGGNEAVAKGLVSGNSVSADAAQN